MIVFGASTVGDCLTGASDLPNSPCVLADHGRIVSIAERFGLFIGTSRAENPSNQLFKFYGQPY